MAREKTGVRANIALVALALVLGLATAAWAHGGDEMGGASKGKPFLTQAEMLKGLAPGSLYPFVDTTPRLIKSAHIAITDSAEACAAGASAPDNVLILVGEAGVALESVMTADTNTGIGSTGQCVFHVTVKAGQDGLPDRITDIVVVNGGDSALTGFNTVTVSATLKGK